MNLTDLIMLWSHASVKVIDIRHAVMDGGEALRGYRLPANAFLYALRGHAHMRLDHSSHRVSRFHVLHGSQRSCLDIEAEERFEYYLILYKAELLPSPPRHLPQLPDPDKPFHYEIGFEPLYPLPLLDKLERMYACWNTPDLLDAFHARSLFYQFVHELLWQMRQQGVSPVQPAPLAQALRYMHDRYMEPITLETIAELLDCSTSYLTKLFKRRMKISPIRLLTYIRLEKAAKLLVRTEATLQETAELVGYPDAHTLSRSFRKHYGLPPVQFRTQYAQEGIVPKLPGLYTKSALVAADPRRYSVNDYNSHLRKRRDGGFTVQHAGRSASLATATLLLGMALFLGACSNGGNVASGGNGVAVSSPSTQPEAATKTYQDSAGTVTIPTDPKRIVDLTGNAIGNLLKLGISPVGVTSDALENPYHEGMLENIVDLGDGTSFEAILAVNPDLIIAFDYMEKTYYEKLEQIAPVIRFTYGAETPVELFVEYGKITRREKEAESWVEQWNRKIAEVKPKIAEAVGSGTVSILQPYAQGIYVWGNKGGRGGEILYDYLELKAPPVIQQTLVDGNEFNGDISLEKVPEYAGNFIFTSNWGGDDGDPDVLYGSSLWKNLPAVKNGHVFFIDPKGSYYNDPISLDAQLELIVESFLGKQS